LRFFAACFARTLVDFGPFGDRVDDQHLRRTSRNVKRWQSGDTCLRWTAAGMLEAEQHFRRIIGYSALAKLALAVERDLAANRPNTHTPGGVPSRPLRSSAARSSTADRHCEVQQRTGHRLLRLLASTQDGGRDPRSDETSTTVPVVEVRTSKLMVRLTGALSNQGTADALDVVLDRKRQLAVGMAASAEPCRTIRLPQGAIQAAVLDVLRAASGPLRPRDIQLRVEARLRRSLSHDTVSSFLSVACRADNLLVERVGYGLYRIGR